MNKKYKNLFKQVLDENGYKYEEGATWTTDGFYRETKEKLEILKDADYIFREEVANAGLDKELKERKEK